MNLFELGQALKHARLDKRLTQRELAHLTGVSLSSISCLERGSLTEIGAVKLIVLFSELGLELHTSVQGSRRTLVDACQETLLEHPESINSLVDLPVESKRENLVRARVRHTKR